MSNRLYVSTILSTAIGGIEHNMSKIDLLSYSKEQLVKERLTISMTLPRQVGKTFAIDSLCGPDDYKLNIQKRPKNMVAWIDSISKEIEVNKRKKYFFDEIDEPTFVFYRDIIMSKYQTVTQDNYPMFIRVSTL